MDTLTSLLVHIRDTLIQLDDFPLATLPLPRRDDSVMIFGGIGLLARRTGLGEFGHLEHDHFGWFDSV